MQRADRSAARRDRARWQDRSRPRSAV